MLKLLTKNNNNLLVTDISNSNDYQYTYQVLDYFKEIYKDAEIYFICGSDNLKELDTWKNYKYILTNYKLLVIKRNNDNIDNILEKYKKYSKNIIISNIKEEYISSTYIRNNLNKEEIKSLLDKNIYKYILTNRLYN